MPSSAPGHSKRYMPNCGRSKRSSTTPSSGEHRIESGELQTKIRRPPGRSKRAASATHSAGSHQMLAPYSDTTRSKVASAKGTSSALASPSETSSPVSVCNRRAVSSCAGVTSTPTGRAPFRANHADTYAVPHPSSTTSKPRTSPRTPTSLSGTPNAPHVISSRSHASRAAASVYSAFVTVQTSRLRRACSGSSIREPEADLPLSRARRIGSVHEVVRHREREVAPDRSGSGLRRIRGSDRRPCDLDRRLTLEDERECRRRRDEADQLPEEGLLPVLLVVTLGQVPIDVNEPRGPHAQPALLEAREDLARQTALHAVRLDQDKCAFVHSRRLFSSSSRFFAFQKNQITTPRTMIGMIMPTSASTEKATESPPPDPPWARRTATRSTLEVLDGARRLDGRLAVRADLPERLERSLATPARLLELGRANGAGQELRLDHRATHRTALGMAERLLHRLHLELPLANVLDVLGRPEEHVQERPQERHGETESNRHAEEDRILDPPPRVLVHPVRRGEPEDGEEEEDDVPKDEPNG